MNSAGGNYSVAPGLFCYTCLSPFRNTKRCNTSALLRVILPATSHQRASDAAFFNRSISP